ncbi:PHP domain-containing protein [Variovorax sp. LjRoot130]|uniref:PHP domain-containing protein n=1 Tax=unclassified Variovorax TaxID=663243 RepID=UPI003ECD1D36
MCSIEPPPFAELHCRSNFTFLVGASQPEEMVERAAAKLYSALALTDECSVSGVVRGHLAAREANIHFICGSEIQLTTQSGHRHARIVFLAQTKAGGATSANASRSRAGEPPRAAIAPW